MPASLVVFKTVEAINKVVNNSINVPLTSGITLYVLPEIGLGVAKNGGALTEAARPVIAAMVDEQGRVLPQYARLYKVNPVSRQEIAGTDVALKLTERTSAFTNGLPADYVAFFLTFQPAQLLDELTTYDFSFSATLAAEWQPLERLVWDNPAYSAGLGGVGGSF